MSGKIRSIAKSAPWFPINLLLVILNIVVALVLIAQLPSDRSQVLLAIIGILLAIVALFGTVLDVIKERMRRYLSYPVVSVFPVIILVIILIAILRPVSVPLPLPMPIGKFNVVVAGFGYQQLSGSVVNSSIADSVSKSIFQELKDSNFIDNIWDQTNVGTILGDSADSRYKQAAAIAANSGAVVVIYGIVREEDNYQIIDPSFYVASNLTNLEPELLGNTSLVEPLEIPKGGVLQTDFQSRLTLIYNFIKALGAYIQGDFKEARQTFELAINSDNSSEVDREVLNIFAGNAAIREGNSQLALSYYGKALELHPNYSRALLGRGAVLFSMAQEKPMAYDPKLLLPENLKCVETQHPLPEQPQLLALLAVNCYEQALETVAIPDLANIELKARWGIGQVYGWLCTKQADTCVVADSNLTYITDFYSKADPESQIQLRFYAGHAYAWRGAILLTEPYTVENISTADNYYKNAIGLLTKDAERNYNKSALELYKQQESALAIWLKNNQAESTPEA